MAMVSFDARVLGLAVAAAMALLVAAPLNAAKEQHQAELSKIVRLNRAPVNRQVLHVALPKPTERRLPNGLDVIILERHRLPTVTFSLWIKAGAIDDPKDLPGLASFTADMLREGTHRRTSIQIATEVDQLGAMLEASAPFGWSYSTVNLSGLSADSSKLLDLLSDIVMNPSFPASELEKFKRRQLANLEAERASPAFLASEKFHQVLYRNFPAAVIAPTAQSVHAVTAEELRNFHERCYAPNNAILGVAGDVNPDDMLALIQQYFGKWPHRTIDEPPVPALPPPAASKIYLVNRPGSVQTNIVSGDYAVRRTDPDFIPLTVMNRVLGGGPAARLFLNLREEHGYTYGAYSAFRADTYPGAWNASTQVHNNVTDGSMHELLGEFKRIRNEPVPVGELDDDKRSLVAAFALELERPINLLNNWMTVKYYGLPENYWDRYPERIASVTAGEVQQAARQYVNLSHLQVVCVGDGSQPGNAQGQPIKDVLRKYGTVEIYDTNGKRID